jgi:dTMP kinase
MKRKTLKKGLFIVIDGIDGSGKSTQAKLLAEYLEDNGRSALLTHEPSESRYGKIIDKILHDKSKHLSHKEWVNLFSADRKVNLKREVIPALKKGKIVISDRYYYSTLAYQLSPKQWQAHVSKFLKPNLTFIFDVPLNIAFERLKKKYAERIDKPTSFEKKKLLQEVRRKFLLMPKLLKEKIILIDGSKSIQDIFSKVKKEVDKYIDNT